MSEQLGVEMSDIWSNDLKGYKNTIQCIGGTELKSIEFGMIKCHITEGPG